MVASSRSSNGRRRRERYFMVGRSNRAGLALHLAAFSVASPRALAFVFPVLPTTGGLLGTNKLISPATRQQHRGSLSAAPPLVETERSGGDGGGSAVLTIAEVEKATARGGASSPTAPGAVAVENPTEKTAALELPVADGEAAEIQIQAVTRRAAKSAPRSLPGTWWTAGLPKWMHLMRRRMITDEDWMHVHAASGAVFLVGSSVYLLHVIGMELFAGIPQLDTTSALPVCMLGAGLVNNLSSIPMAKTRSWYLTVIISVIQLWACWYVSGAYPAYLAPADPWVASAAASVLVIACVEAEDTIQSEKRRRKLLARSGRSLKPSGHVGMRPEDQAAGDAMNRYGTLSNLLFFVPLLYATVVGSGWVERLAEAYPAAPALLFHAYFSAFTSGSLALLAPTLYQRRLIDANGMAAFQLFTLTPFVTSMLDVMVMGSAATTNPIEIYLGFLH